MISWSIQTTHGHCSSCETKRWGGGNCKYPISVNTCSLTGRVPKPGKSELKGYELLQDQIKRSIIRDCRKIHFEEYSPAVAVLIAAGLFMQRVKIEKFEKSGYYAAVPPPPNACAWWWWTGRQQRWRPLFSAPEWWSGKDDLYAKSLLASTRKPGFVTLPRQIEFMRI